MILRFDVSCQGERQVNNFPLYNPHAVICNLVVSVIVKDDSFISFTYKAFGEFDDQAISRALDSFIKDISPHVEMCVSLIDDVQESHFRPSLILETRHLDKSIQAKIRIVIEQKFNYGEFKERTEKAILKLSQ